MGAFIGRLLDMSLGGAIVIAAILPLRLLLKKAPHRVTVWLWALAAVRLLLPFTLSSPVALTPDLGTVLSERPAAAETTTLPSDSLPTVEPGQTRAADGEESGAPTGTLPTPVLPAVPASETPTSPGLPGTVVIPETQASPAPASSVSPTPEGSTRRTLDRDTLYFAVWAAGAAGMLLYAAVSYLRLSRKTRARLKTGDGAYLCDALPGPFVLGALKPKIFLPSDLPEDVKWAVLAHEKAHLERYDPLVKLLGFGVLALHWFNPLVWAAYLLLGRDVELAADEAALREKSPDERRSYAEALLSCTVHPRRLNVAPLGFGEIGIKTRIKNMSVKKKLSAGLAVVLVLAVGAIGVFLMTHKDPPEKNGPEDLRRVDAVGEVPDALREVVKKNLFYRAKSDRGRLFVTTTQTAADGTLPKFRLTVMDKNGRCLGTWEQFGHTPRFLSATGDGGFLSVTGLTLPMISSAEPTPAVHLVKNDEDVNLLWMKRLDGVTDSDSVFAYEKDGQYWAFAAVAPEETEEAQDAPRSDLGVWVFAPDGTRVAQRTIGGSGDDRPVFVRPADGGFEATALTESEDGDFSGFRTGGGLTPAALLIDKDLNVKLLGKSELTSPLSRLGDLDGETLYSLDGVISVFDAGKPSAVVDYGEYFLVVSENRTGKKNGEETEDAWTTETVYSGYGKDGELLFRAAVDSTDRDGVYALKVSDPPVAGKEKERLDEIDRAEIPEGKKLRQIAELLFKCKTETVWGNTGNEADLSVFFSEERTANADYFLDDARATAILYSRRGGRAEDWTTAVTFPQRHPAIEGDTAVLYAYVDVRFFLPGSDSESGVGNDYTFTFRRENGVWRISDVAFYNDWTTPLRDPEMTVEDFVALAEGEKTRTKTDSPLEVGTDGELYSSENLVFDLLFKNTGEQALYFDFSLDEPLFFLDAADRNGWRRIDTDTVRFPDLKVLAPGESTEGRLDLRALLLAPGYYRLTFPYTLGGPDGEPRETCGYFTVTTPLSRWKTGGSAIWNREE